MKNLAFALTILLLFATGCARRESENQPAPQHDAAHKIAESPSSAHHSQVAHGSSREDEIGSVINHLAHRVVVRYDRYGESAEGKLERQVFLEVVDGTLAEAKTLVSEQLLARGYLVGHHFEDENGARQLFRKAGGAPIRSLSREKGVGPALKDERAVGSIYLKQ